MLGFWSDFVTKKFIAGDADVAKGRGYAGGIRATIGELAKYCKRQAVSNVLVRQLPAVLADENAHLMMVAGEKLEL